MVKILHINKSFSGGGIEKYLRELMNHFGKNHQVDALVVNDKFKTEEINYSEHNKIMKLPKLFEFASAKISLSYPFYLNKLVKKYDILHFHYPNPIGELSWLLTLNKDVKTVVTYHNDVAEEKTFSTVYNKLMKKFFAQVDKVIVTSKNLAETSQVLEEYQDKVEIVPLGINLNKFSQKSFEINNNENEDDNAKPKILYVGRLAKVKGISYLIKAMKKIDATLDIVGKGPLKEKMNGLVKKEKLDSKINLLGFVSEEKLIKLYHDADIFVLPSVYRGEGFGYVLLEAMLCKTACISTELGTGTSFVNQDGETGFVVSPRNSEMIADKVNYLINNKEVLNQFKQNAYERVKNNFSLKKMYSQIDKVYKEVLEEWT